MAFFIKEREIFEELSNTEITWQFKIKCDKASSFSCSFWDCLKITEGKSQSSNHNYKIILEPLKCLNFQNETLCSEWLIYSVLPHNTLDYYCLSCFFLFWLCSQSFPTLLHLYAHQHVILESKGFGILRICKNEVNLSLWICMHGLSRPISQ